MCEYPLRRVFFYPIALSTNNLENSVSMTPEEGRLSVPPLLPPTLLLVVFGAKTIGEPDPALREFSIELDD